MSKGYPIEWSSCTALELYIGGYVMEPTRGVHENVFVCDFKSMYPIIMASYNINPHSFEAKRLDRPNKNGQISVSGDFITMRLNDTDITFSSRKSSIISRFIRYLVEERDKHKTSLSMYAKSLKILLNSVYGSLRYSNFRLYSPIYAASVMAVSRYCVSLSRKFFLKEGLSVVYGDTDSCMVTGGASL